MSEQLSLFSSLPPEPPAVRAAPSASAELTPTITDEWAAVWGLPLGRRVRVELRDHAVPGLLGVMQVVTLPDLPFDARQALRLRIGREEFSSQQIVAWSLVE